MHRDYNYPNAYHYKGYRIVLNADTWDIYQGLKYIIGRVQNRNQARHYINNFLAIK